MKLWKSLKVSIGTRSEDRNHQHSETSAWCTQHYELDVFKSQTSLSTDSGLCTNERGLRKTQIELVKSPGMNIGIILAGRSEPGLVPSIAGFSKDSVALECDKFAPGDRICSINGISTTRLTNDEVLRLLDNVEDRASLEVEYYMPNYTSQNSLYIITKLAEVPVEKINGSLGVTIRGGLPEHTNDPCANRTVEAHPLIITHIRPGGAAYTTSRIKPGDRLLKVDHISLTNKTLSEVHQILQNCPQITSLTIEYDVSIMESVKHATGPLLIEIERPCNEDLGLFLSNQRYIEDCYSSGSETYQRVGHSSSGVYIDSILPASISDRCGALHPGDQILAFDEMIIENNNYTAEEVMCYLENVSDKGYTQLHVAPRHVIMKNGRFTRENSLSGNSTLNTRRQKSRNLRQSSIPKLSLQEDYDCQQNYVSTVGVLRSEVLMVQLEIPPDEDSGITVFEENNTLHISHIGHLSPAYRSGCIQTRDKILSINGHENLKADIANDILQRKNDSHTNKYISLKIEFSMANTVEASSGVFNVKLAKTTSGLGVTITGSKVSNGPMIISEVRPGTPAYRSGALQPGDQLLAINNQPLHQLSLETAFNILQNSPEDIITLKIRKVDNSEEWSENQTKQTLKTPHKIYNNIETKALVHNGSPKCKASEQKHYSGENGNTTNCLFTIELTKQGNGPLGLTIAGSEDVTQPIILSGLIEGGIAEKSGKLKIGDEILAINGESVLNKPLSEAIKLLQECNNQVYLRISRKVTDTSMCVDTNCTRDSNLCSNHSNSSPGLSNDSAVESWDQNSPVRNSTILGNDVIEYAVPDKTRINENKTLHYSPTDEDKLMASNYMTPNIAPAELPLPNYSLNNSLKTFHYENSCIIPDNAMSKQKTREDDVNQIEILTNNMKECKLHNSEKMNCRCDYVTMTPYSPKTLNRVNWENRTENYSNGIYTLTNNQKSPTKPGTSYNPYGNVYENEIPGIYTMDTCTSASRGTIHHVILYKDAIYDDYGFSISDGLYDRGVYINRIRRGGPADIVGLLKPYDRILQVNGTRTVDYDCCLTVPLIASAGDRLEIVVQRLKGAQQRNESPQDDEDTIITKTI